MKLENQVCSLELAKRLKELGVKQKSLFYWTRYDTCGGTASAVELPNYFLRPNSEVPTDERWRDCYSAFTVAEFGEILPAHIWSPDGSMLAEISYSKSNDNGKTVWVVGSMAMENIYLADTEADARAKMVIYLKENNLI